MPEILGCVLVMPLVIFLWTGAIGMAVDEYRRMRRG